MPSAEKLADFVAWCRQNLTDDEKGEAQIFRDRPVQAFGHAGLREDRSPAACPFGRLA